MSRDGRTTRRRRAVRLSGVLLASAALLIPGVASATSAGTNVRVTVDTGSTYLSADQIGGTGTYSDAVLQRCGVDRRMQNEPTLAIDPRNPSVWASGSNDYCTVPTVRDAWAGFYRSTNAGATWTDSLLPGYLDDTSGQGLGSPLHALSAGGAIAAGDPVMSWDGQGRLFYMGNNFNRGTENGVSARFRNNTGSIWVATYGPANDASTGTDGSKYLRTVVLATNTFGQGSFNDKTNLVADPATGNVYAAWSEFHGSGCNQIDFSRSTDHGVTFSAPMKLSSGVCGNQGPSIAVGSGGNLYVAWQATTGGSFGQNGVNGAAFVSSSNFGQTFTQPKLAATFVPFTSDMFSGNGSRDCGDAPYNCPSGFTFPRFDLASPYLAFDSTTGNLVMAFQAAKSSGQGQIDATVSTNGGRTWSTPTPIADSTSGHQFFPFLTASAGRVSAIWYDSAGDPAYAPTRPPCNDASGNTTACLNVRYAQSTDGGVTWSTSPLQVTDQPTNPNYEQFGGRRIPFFGDYITVAAQGNTIGAVWTDQRDTVGASDTTGDNDGADVAGDPETGGTCSASTGSPYNTCFDGTGGLDQNIYAATITP